MRILSMAFSFSCLFSSICSAQKTVKTFDIHLGYSRDISKISNMTIKGAFNEAKPSFNGFALSATYNISKLIAVKLETANHFSTSNIQTAIVYRNGQMGTIYIAGGSTKQRRTAFLGGIQLKKELSNPRFTPFGHLLVGMHSQNLKINESSNQDHNQATTDLFGSYKITSTGFATGLGAGLDVNLNDKLDIRAIQLNYIINFIGDKMLSNQSVQYNNTSGQLYQVEIKNQRQKQFTIGLGVVYHL